MGVVTAGIVLVNLGVVEVAVEVAVLVEDSAFVAVDVIEVLNGLVDVI